MLRLGLRPSQNYKIYEPLRGYTAVRGIVVYYRCGIRCPLFLSNDSIGAIARAVHPA